MVSWTVLFHPAFDSEFQGLSEAVQDELLAHAKVLELMGPAASRHAEGLAAREHEGTPVRRGQMASGASPSRSTQDGRQSCSLPGTSPVEAKTSSIGS
jgi:hypothetical protein